MVLCSLKLLSIESVFFFFPPLKAHLSKFFKQLFLWPCQFLAAAWDRVP